MQPQKIAKKEWHSFLRPKNFRLRDHNKIHHKDNDIIPKTATQASTGWWWHEQVPKIFFQSQFSKQPTTPVWIVWLLFDGFLCYFLCRVFWASCRMQKSWFKKNSTPPCSCRSKTSSAHLHCDAEVLPRDPSLPRSGADGVVAQNRVLLTTELIIKLKHKTIWKLSKNWLPDLWIPTNKYHRSQLSQKAPFYSLFHWTTTHWAWGYLSIRSCS